MVIKETDRSVSLPQSRLKDNALNLKETIIHESLKLFSLKGFIGTSIQDILEAANTSKGGFYNHFSSKEALFFQVIDEARKIWREKNLKGLDKIETPTEIIKRLLKNYKDRYLKDADNFPGGCVFITLAAELNDQNPRLSRELEKGFVGLKGMLRRLLEQGKASGKLAKAVNTDAVTEILFSGMLGASLVYGVNKSRTSLDRSINALIQYLDQLTIPD